MLLLVDDDPKSPGCAERVLKVQGEILFARTADQAVSLLRRFARDVSAVLVAGKVAGQNTESFIVQMAYKYPTVPIIALGGAFHENIIQSAEALAVVGAITPPIWDYNFAV